MLGTNDAQGANLDKLGVFPADAEAMVRHFLDQSQHPRLFLMTPPPAFASVAGITDATLTTTIIPALLAVAKKCRVPVIDIHTGLAEDRAMSPDGIHFDDAGLAKIANLVAAALQATSTRKSP